MPVEAHSRKLIPACRTSVLGVSEALTSGLHRHVAELRCGRVNFVAILARVFSIIVRR